MFLPETLRAIFETIKACRKILLVTHNNPDGDALACISLMLEVCQRLDKTATAYCSDQYGSAYEFLPHLEKLIADRQSFDFNDFDLIISLDCGSLARTGLAEEIVNRQHWQIYAEIDHHPRLDSTADLEAREPQAAASVEILYQFFKVNNLLIDAKSATAILTGLVTDTGNFIYPATDANTIAIAAAMVSHGARLPQIVEQTWRNKSLTAMRLWGLALTRLQINQRHNIAFTVLTPEDFSNFFANEEDLDGVSGFLSNLPQVKAMIFLRQTEPGVIKGSLRTNQPNVDVAKLARFWGGGGHHQAAGFAIKGNLKFINNRWQILD